MQPTSGLSIRGRTLLRLGLWSVLDGHCRVSIIKAAVSIELVLPLKDSGVYKDADAKTLHRSKPRLQRFSQLP